MAASTAGRSSSARSGSGVGAKHRKLYTPVRCRPGPQEWRDYLGKQGCDGGMAMLPMTEEDYHKEHVVNMNLKEIDIGEGHIALAKQDYLDVARFLSGSAARRSSVEWSLPVKVWLLVLRPRWVPRGWTPPPVIVGAPPQIGGEVVKAAVELVWRTFGGRRSCRSADAWAGLGWSPRTMAFRAQADNEFYMDSVTFGSATSWRFAAGGGGACWSSTCSVSLRGADGRRLRRW